MNRLAPWEVLESRYLLKKRWLNVREDRVRTSSGVVLDEFHVLEAPHWACVCCITTERELVLIRQYRHGAGAVTLELPAGVIEDGEAPLAGAERELREETGYVSRRWEALAVLNPEPSRHTHRAHCFVAFDAEREGAQALDAAEQVEVVRVPVEQTLELIQSGRLDHAVHVAACLLARGMNFL